jgi:Zn-dependent membrane protease YugP
MIYALISCVLILAIYAPSLWVRFVLHKHSGEIEDMPGTGAELARHLVERFELEDVQVVEGEKDRDHYNPADRIISLSPDVYARKSLTAIAVATHEVGHAIQFGRNEPISQLRGKYLGKALRIKRIGTIILMSIPLVAAIFKVPHVIVLTAFIGVVTMLSSAAMYVAILPEEYDASFNKALPILEAGYVPEQHIPAVRQVLRAAAYTYVAGALADVLSLWRWLRVFR